MIIKTVTRVELKYGNPKKPLSLFRFVTVGSHIKNFLLSGANKNKNNQLALAVSQTLLTGKQTKIKRLTGSPAISAKFETKDNLDVYCTVNLPPIFYLWIIY